MGVIFGEDVGIEGVWSCDKARDGGRNGVEKWGGI